MTLVPVVSRAPDTVKVSGFVAATVPDTAALAYVLLVTAPPSMFVLLISVPLR